MGMKAYWRRGLRAEVVEKAEAEVAELAEMKEAAEMEEEEEADVGLDRGGQVARAWWRE